MPLSRRTTGLPAEPLVDGVPDWLYAQLQTWLYHVLQFADGPITALRPGHDLTGSTRQVMLRVRTSTQPWLIPADDPTFLDALDAAIRWGEFDHHGFTTYGDPSSLEGLLAAANSAWRVNAESRGLERRIDPTITRAVTTARSNANAESAEHLRVAWDAAYGLYPDPDKAYDEAVLAVEALVCPLVCPNNGRRTLGTVIRDLGNQRDQWQLAIGDKDGQPASPDRLEAMLALLWEGQSRHAGSPNSRRQTQTEAQAAVHLAATIVQWLSTGVLSHRTT
jgi:hypothetical protein